MKGGSGAVALVLAALVCGMPASALAEKQAPAAFERDVVEVAAPEGVTISLVRIDNRLGNVAIYGHDSESIKIQSFKRANDASTLERLVVSLVPDAQGRVRVTTALKAGAEYRPVKAGSMAVDLVVFVPRHAAVDAEIWNGTLEVSKVDNGARLLVDEGRIDVRHVSGQVVSAMRKGEQAFAEVFGELDTRSVEGDMRLHTISGKRLVANLVRGTIEGQRLQVEEMQVRSVYGDIELMAELLPGGHYVVASRRGNVSLRFHGQTPVAVSIRAKSAMIGPGIHSSKKREGHWQGHFGKRQAVRPAQLELRSSAGTVLVKHF